jgi:hypothetical protein
MPKENDLEGRQDQGGKHGGQKGMPKPEPWPPQKTEIPSRDRAEPVPETSVDADVVRQRGERR